MKKYLAVCLAVILMTVFLASCGSGGETGVFPADSSQDTEQSPASDTSEQTWDTPSPDTGEDTPPAIQPVIADYTVKDAEWVDVEWESYASPYFTLTIPRGWKVEWRGDANQMQWMASSPDGSVGLTNLDHAWAAKDARMTEYLGFSLSMTSGTVQEYFEENFKDSTEYFEVKNSCVPENKDVIQSARPNTPIRDYKALYATFKENGLDGEGIYSAVVMESRDVFYNGYNYGAWEINCICTEWAPLGSLVNWAPVIATVFSSFRYTDYYIQQWRLISQSATTPYSNVNDNDPVMEAFEERSLSDTIIQEKRSDMIGEYERVYDVDTGNIYRAYNGFLDDIGDQNKYIAITDNQYAEGYVGWIDKD